LDVFVCVTKAVHFPALPERFRRPEEFASEPRKPKQDINGAAFTSGRRYGSGRNTGAIWG